MSDGVNCIPKKNSRAYSNSSQVDCLLDIDCAICDGPRMCRVKVTLEQKMIWESERGVEVA